MEKLDSNSLGKVSIGKELYSRTLGKVILIESNLTNGIKVKSTSGNEYRVTIDGHLEFFNGTEMVISNEPDIFLYSEGEFKDGDILICNDGISDGMFIFKEIDPSLSIPVKAYYYFGFIEKAQLFIGCLYPNHVWTNNLSCCRKANETEILEFSSKLNEKGLFWSASQKTLHEIYKPGDILTIKKTGEVFIYDSFSICGIKSKVFINKSGDITTGEVLELQLEDVYRSTECEILSFSLKLAKDFNWNNHSHSIITAKEEINDTEDKGLLLNQQNLKLINDKDETQNQVNQINEKSNAEITKPKLKKFDQVLVRDNDYDTWEKDVFDSFNSSKNIYVCLNGGWKQCVPYNPETSYLIKTKLNYIN